MTDLEIGSRVALATAILWTLSSLAWTSAGRRIGALPVSFLRLIVAAGLMVAYCRIVRGLWLPTDAGVRTWLWLGASGFFGFFLCDICLFKSMLLLGPRLTLLLFSLSPPIAAIISWTCTSDKLTLQQWTAMAVTLAGVVWVVLEQPGKDQPLPMPGHRWRGVVLGLLAAFTNGIGYVLSKEGNRRRMTPWPAR